MTTENRTIEPSLRPKNFDALLQGKIDHIARSLLVKLIEQLFLDMSPEGDEYWNLDKEVDGADLVAWIVEQLEHWRLTPLGHYKEVQWEDLVHSSRIAVLPPDEALSDLSFEYIVEDTETRKIRRILAEDLISYRLSAEAMTCEGRVFRSTIEPGQTGYCEGLHDE